ncbi:MAG: hypothetical protein GF372_08955 [Candidatus Marinimicrobia bacterium]|nr:hypothetical protein [Candidatus Neomarinimicrobiota bacterium]
MGFSGITGYLLGVTILLGVISILSFFVAISALKRRKKLGLTINFFIGVIFLLFALLTGTFALSIQGYSALTREEVAAVVQTEPIDEKRFRATFFFQNSEQASFEIAGEQLYVDAHILKWKPLVNILGMHTLYELDRVAGRYSNLSDEQTNPRTVYSLAQQKPLDLFELRQKYPVLEPLVDAEYGSATFIAVNTPAVFEIRISTSGLLVRKISE